MFLQMIKLTLLTCYLTAAVGAYASSITLSNPRCEYRENPIGVEMVQPRLSWQLESTARGILQSAYQVIVASSSELLKKEVGDLWDSGKVDSDQSIQVPYSGKAPASGQTCFWKVRVWNQMNDVSGWSEPASWTMGLIQPTDWKARWIGFSPPVDLGNPTTTLNRLLVLEDNYWVWANGTVSGDQPPGKVFFRKVIEIPADQTVVEAVFLMTADDTLQLFVNGKAVGPEHGNWKQLARRDLASQLRPGANLIGIEARNLGDNPAGLIGRLVVVYASGQTLSVPIDRSWLSRRVESPGWNTVEFKTSEWKPAAEIVRFGDPSWGKLVAYVLKPAPLFRKVFTVRKPIRRATAFASALGVYELHLNGKAVDTDALSPGWTDFSKRVHYLGYDVTAGLKRGENVVGAILGDGWYASYLAFTGKRNYYGGEPRLIVQLQIDYQDGTREIIGTDETWQAATGPIREADLLMGCVYDARAEQKGWDKADFDDRAWQPAQVDGAAKANLVAHPGEPIRRIEEIVAKAVTQPKPGVYVFDLKQNMVGWVRLKIKGVPGQKVVVRHAEMLNPDGTIYLTNLRAAKATDTYYLAGQSKRAYEPSFTFHGFQFVEITGLDYQPELSDVTGVVLHSDLPQAGWFECSEPLVNKLTLNSLWGQKGNFLDVPTDCPQRDERAGWTGDAQVFMKTACFNLDSPAFYMKWLEDLCQDSQRADGGFGDVAPSLSVVGFGNTGWSDAGPVCNWRMFEMYGDTRVLEKHYASLVRHMDYLAGSSKDFMRGTGAYGDWLRLAGPQHSQAIGTAYYFYTAQVMARIATALGKTEDVEKWGRLSGNIRAAFVKNFIKEDGQIVDEKNQTGQTFYALAFGLDLVPSDLKAKVAEQFVASIGKENDHLATGFLGTPFVLFALQNAGHPELAYKLVLNRTYPSWLQQVLWGSTTMWERWDGWRPEKGFQNPGMNSFNHYWLGCVSEWLFTQVAGIDTDGPGFRRIFIRPELVKPETGFSWVNASYRSIRGRIASSWKMEGDRFRLNVTIPGNSLATVYIPAKTTAEVTENGKAINDVKGVKLLRIENGRAIFEVGSGDYKFVSRAVTF
jgi:alpha-L-rhamnosidase